MSSVLGASCILSIIATAGMVSLGTEALLSSQEAQAAADLAALSGAMAVLSGDGEGCEVAGAFVRANDARLVSCESEGEMLTVHVERFGRKAAATAGPVLR